MTSGEEPTSGVRAPDKGGEETEVSAVGTVVTCSIDDTTGGVSCEVPEGAPTCESRASAWEERVDRCFPGFVAIAKCGGVDPARANIPNPDHSALAS